MGLYESGNAESENKSPILNYINITNWGFEIPNWVYYSLLGNSSVSPLLLEKIGSKGRCSRCFRGLITKESWEHFYTWFKWTLIEVGLVNINYYNYSLSHWRTVDIDWSGHLFLCTILSIEANNDHFGQVCYNW